MSPVCQKTSVSTALTMTADDACVRDAAAVSVFRGRRADSAAGVVAVGAALPNEQTGADLEGKAGGRPPEDRTPGGSRVGPTSSKGVLAGDVAVVMNGKVDGKSMCAAAPCRSLARCSIGVALTRCRR